MAPPLYTDLGKACRDIFNKGYCFNQLKIDAKLKNCYGSEVGIGGTHDLKEMKDTGFFESKIRWPCYGVIFSHRWSTDNNIKFELTCNDNKIADGLVLTGEGTWNPESNDKTAKGKIGYLHPNANVNMSVYNDDKTGNVEVGGTCVTGYDGYMAGYEIAFDTHESKLTKNNCAIGYCGKDFQFLMNAENYQEFGGSYYQRVNPRAEAGVQIKYKPGEQSELSLGTRFLADPATAIRAKVNNKSILGVCIDQKIKDGITLSMCTEVDIKEFNAGGHKVGLGLLLEQ